MSQRSRSWTSSGTGTRGRELDAPTVGSATTTLKSEDRLAWLVLVLWRLSGLVEGVGLRDVRRDRGLFVVVRLEFLCLLERVRLRDRLGFLGQTSSLFITRPSLIRHRHSLAAFPVKMERDHKREKSPRMWRRIADRGQRPRASRA